MSVARGLRPLAVWLALTSAVLVALAWQTGDLLRPQEPPRPVLPEKLRSHDRAPRLAAPPATAESYQARLAQGTSRREMRWMLDDLSTAGLDPAARPATLEDHLRQRAAAQRWYLAALRDGLGLQAEQRRQAAARLAERLETAAAEFREDIERGPLVEHEGRSFRVVDGAAVRRFLAAPFWLPDPAFAPWTLCDLDPGQLELLWHAEAAEADDWTDFAVRWKFPDPENGEPLQGTFEPDLAPGPLAPAGRVFPFSPTQDLSPARPLADRAAELHPAQLRLLLLWSPETAADLLLALDAEENAGSDGP